MGLDPPKFDRRWRRLDHLERASAFRIYEDPAELLRYIDEIGRWR